MNVDDRRDLCGLKRVGSGEGGQAILCLLMVEMPPDELLKGCLIPGWLRGGQTELNLQAARALQEYSAAGAVVVLPRWVVVDLASPVAAASFGLTSSTFAPLPSAETGVVLQNAELRTCHHQLERIASCWDLASRAARLLWSNRRSGPRWYCYYWNHSSSILRAAGDTQSI